ncbi:hypothetical protein Val02_23080 [Virgisporangium aliadipatigenens]|uniref:Peptide N-acetyl-beta-D-glucosaminyl asparaginase amidase A N-terminal domain-containing protein n=1 Tax=Virgisporangium aliadipatigenens TaxID=741659 RepID=A0A8J3YJA3_9ACTN|nr:peptide-N4-asparagine amidase [Virgisporangium aliadipatigenens]GIJ45422.1 hypothetical protein Val02_23080 [Virgisporangium aliadipatigenens]
MLRRLVALGCVLFGFLITGAGPARAEPAVPVPVEFGSDWDDPRTAAPPVEHPRGRSCTVQIVDTEFRDFTPYTSTFTPPAACRGPWQKVVLRLDGAVAGRQYDRLGYLRIGGVTVFKTSTPEPSVDGIQWTVEKDLTGYAPLLSAPQPVEMLIGNVVNDTYTGILDVRVSLTFYPGRPPAGEADTVLGLAGQHNEGTSLVGDLTVPRNTERLVADVYATGSGGGCEEFWYLTTPTGAPYSCPADNGPHREVQVRIDGVLAGVAAPYPHIYTGGWSNPFLWYVLPAPRAFDIQPVRYDLTPFVGRLTDGLPHRVSVSVLGVPEGQTGWDVPTTFLAWRDARRGVVTGALVESGDRDATNSAVYAPGHSVATTASHSFSAAGYVDTSHGRVFTSVSRSVGHRSTHRWNDDETSDSLSATWTDSSTVDVRPGRKTTVDRRYGMDGTVTIDAADRLTTTIALSDGWTSGPTTMLDTYTGEASWLLNVPRDQRHATGTSTERYRLHGPGVRYDRTISVTNGIVTRC